MSKIRIVSGITTTGELTLGNYIGALRNFVKLQDEFEMYLFIANLHGITSPIDANVLKENIKKMTALYFACGIDPQKANVFLQSDVIEHTLLGWILSCNTTIGELSRMTQYKDKSAKNKSGNSTEFVPTGILIYPCLMAADILLYDAELVPVGKDQKQHIELARNIAERINNRVKKDLFKIPKEFTPEQGAKIMDLQDPTKKMSKSGNNEKGFIKLLDPIDSIRKKIKSAVTDSENLVKYDVEKKPGVSNLLMIYSSLKDIKINEAEKEFENKDYGFFKNAVAEAIIEVIEPIQKRYYELVDSKEVGSWLDNGARKAKEIASKKIEEVLSCTGLSR